jgi:hypothetical protein
VDASDFSILVGRLERESDDNKKFYAAKVACVAALGYAPAGITISAILFASYFAIHSLIFDERVNRIAVIGFIAGAAALFALVRALIVRTDPPGGRVVGCDDAPELFATIDDVLQRMAVKRKGKSHTVEIATVTLDNEFNASLCQIPRWGVFGNYSNHLQIGLPLMALLDAAELKTVLAHEIGHLGGQQGRFAAWIYRQRITWRALQHKFEEPKNFFEKMLARFYRWYVPYFDAYTFVLARNHEYQADRAASRATNLRLFARALVKVNLAGRFLSEVFWPRFFAQVENVPQPPYLPFSMLPKALVVAQKEWLRNDWLQSALSRFAAEHDTHPGLGERLAALDVGAELPTQLAGKSALALLGADAAALLKGCDDEWQAENAQAWRKRHNDIKEARWKIAQYENMPPEELNSEAVWEKSLLLLDIGDEEDAVAELQELVAHEPAVAKAQFLLGQLLLGRGDESALNNLVEAAKHDSELIESAGELGYGYLMDRGRKGEAKRFWDRIQAA